MSDQSQLSKKEKTNKDKKGGKNDTKTGHRKSTKRKAGIKVTTKPKRVCLNRVDLPLVENLSDLLKVANSVQMYKHVDNVALWKITPYLRQLNDMIGMKELKNTIFLQILYYIQGFHIGPNTSTHADGDYLHTIIYGAPGSGKCLAYDTPVLRSDGRVVKVQDIRKGDKLMGDDCKPRTVTSVCTGQEDMYRITQSHGVDYTVNESHILTLKRIVKPHYTSDGVFVWYDDNGIHREPDGVSFAHREEIEMDDVIDIPVKNYLSMPDEWKCAYKGIRKIVKLPYTKLNTTEHEYARTQSFTESISTDIKYNHVRVRKTFLAELLGRLKTAEGKSAGHLSVYIPTNATDAFIDDFRWLVHSLGITTTQGVGDELILKYCFFNRKLVGRVRLFIEPVLESVIQVDHVGMGNYYGFSLDSLDTNRRFLLADGTVTHNTTVAKIIGKIYQKLGILHPNGPFITAHREDLVAEYLGHTAIKVRKLMESALGGVLFIDEIYSMGSSDSKKDTFSKEAIDTLNAFLSEHKNEMCLIVAGYEEEIESCFLSVNRGLKRRFQWSHKISTYKIIDLYDILIQKIKQIGWTIAFEKEDAIKLLTNVKFKYAGGDIENYLTKIKIAHSFRIFSSTGTNKFVITLEDITKGMELMKSKGTFDSSEQKFSEPPMGMYT